MTNDARVLSAARLAEIRERADGASVGTWEVWETSQTEGCWSVAVTDGYGLSPVAEECTAPDAAFIAASRTDVPALLAHISVMAWLLRDHQYYRDYAGDDEQHCRYCEALRRVGCSPHCIAAALLGAEPTPP